MTYDFFCDNCHTEVSLEQGMHDDHTPPRCKLCGWQTRRLYMNHYIPDEIKGTKYFHPKHREEVKDHGRVFDLGLGAWYETKSERKRIMKEKGLHEIGPQKDP